MTRSLRRACYHLSDFRRKISHTAHDSLFLFAVPPPQSQAGNDRVGRKKRKNRANHTFSLFFSCVLYGSNTKFATILSSTQSPVKKVQEKSDGRKKESRR
jgi:hypothetical protein